MNAAVLIVNEKFKVPLNVVLNGLSKYNFRHDIIIFYDIFFEDLDFYKKIYSDLNIIFKQIDIEKYSNLSWSVHNRDWEINPFYRFEIFKLNHYDKILYLDTDIIIVDNINEIFALEGDFCVVELAKISNLAYVPFGQKGFNAGVMLIGKKYLTNEVQNDLINMCKNYIHNGNQKPLNLYFAGKVNFMDVKYNLTTDLLTSERIENAKIIHFIGDKKPWNGKGISSFCDYVKKIIGEHLLIKVFNIYQREFSDALQRLILN